MGNKGESISFANDTVIVYDDTWEKLKEKTEKDLFDVK